MYYEDGALAEPAAQAASLCVRAVPALHLPVRLVCGPRPANPRPRAGLRATPQGGGGNPFDMKNLMESVKKAQQLVQTETARVQAELAA
jgi:hypothetical protein